MFKNERTQAMQMSDRTRDAIRSTPTATTLEAAKYASEIRATLDRIVAAASSGQPVDPEDAVVLRGSAEAILEVAAKAIPMFDLESIKPSPEAVQANQSRLRGDQEPCAVCGKSVRNVHANQVHISEHGNLYPVAIGTEVARGLPEGTMYFYSVGPDCAKRIPAGYLHRA